MSLLLIHYRKQYFLQCPLFVNYLISHSHAAHFFLLKNHNKIPALPFYILAFSFFQMFFQQKDRQVCKTKIKQCNKHQPFIRWEKTCQQEEYARNSRHSGNMISPLLAFKRCRNISSDPAQQANRPENSVDYPHCYWIMFIQTAHTFLPGYRLSPNFNVFLGDKSIFIQKCILILIL